MSLSLTIDFFALKDFYLCVLGILFRSLLFPDFHRENLQMKTYNRIFYFVNGLYSVCSMITRR